MTSTTTSYGRLASLTDYPLAAGTNSRIAEEK